jgi:hypothetical protein
MARRFLQIANQKTTFSIILAPYKDGIAGIYLAFEMDFWLDE